MARVLLRSAAPADPAYGFRRDDALFAVVFVTDEADCSTNPATLTEVFLSAENGGNEVFWTNPGEVQPTSGVCWKAGVACTGLANGTYDECHAVDLAVSGEQLTSDMADAAILVPVAKYVLAAQEQNEVFIAAIAGVPEGYESGQTDILYRRPDLAVHTRLRHRSRLPVGHLHGRAARAPAGIRRGLRR